MMPSSTQELRALKMATELAAKQQSLLAKNKEAAKHHLLAMQLLLAKKVVNK